MAGINGYPGALDDIVQGDYRILQVHASLVDAGGNAMQADLQNMEFYLTFGDLDPDTAPALEIHIPAGANLDDTQEIVEIPITSIHSASLAAGEVYYSVRMIDTTVAGAGKAYVLDMGQINILKAVSSQVGG